MIIEKVNIFFSNWKLLSIPVFKYYFVKKGKSSIKSDKHKIIDATHILFYNNKYFE